MERGENDMAPLITSPVGKLILGLITGFIFGFLLQKGQVVKYERIVGALRLQDFTIIKFMISAILVGMVGIYLMKDAGVIELNIKPTHLGANVIGGLIFGMGFGLLGYCPGTAIGAVGEGRMDALWGGVLGMLVGAGIYAEAYSFLKDNLLTWGSIGKATLPSVLGINHWIIILSLWILLVILMRQLENPGR
jgi:uncharacterized membrane protein YedE/YeeE